MSAISPYTRTEVAVGFFVLVGVAALAYLSIALGGLRLGGSDDYALSARFSSVGGLKVGDPVKLAGVSVGEVEAIGLEEFVALTELSVQRSVRLPADTIASVQTDGLLGSAYVALSPGASTVDLVAGDRIERTEPAISLTELIAKYAFGEPLASPSKPSSGASKKPGPLDDLLEDL